MLREHQKKLKEKIEDVQDQNYKLRKLVDQSNVDAVRAAIKEKDAALKTVEEERQKVNIAKKNAKDEIAKAKKQATVKIEDFRNKMKFWQVMAAALFGLGLAMGWLL